MKRNNSHSSEIKAHSTMGIQKVSFAPALVPETSVVEKKEAVSVPVEVLLPASGVEPTKSRRGSFGGLSTLTKGLLENESHIKEQDKLLKEQGELVQQQGELLQKVDMAIAGLTSQIQRQEAHIKEQESTLAKQQKAVDVSISLIKQLEDEIDRIWLD